MARGRKTGGGSRKGIPNKPKQELLAQIQERFPGYHPVLAMSEIANDDAVDLNTRLMAHKEVAQYVEPKRKAIEHSGDALVLPVVQIGAGALD